MTNGVQFDVETVQRPQYKKTESKMIQWAINHSCGLIKNEMQANIALIVMALLMLALSFYLAFGGSVASTPAPMPGDLPPAMQ